MKQHISPLAVSARNAVLTLMACAAGTGSAAAADQDPGETVFKHHCAACHTVDGSHAPRVSSLREMSPHAIDSALTLGKMATQGAALSETERRHLVEWLTASQTDYSGWEQQAACSTPPDGQGEATPWVTGWGIGEGNHRYQSRTRINAGNVGQLQQKWVLAFPGVATMRSQPAVVGDTLYLAVADSYTLYAIDRHSGCIRWHYLSESAPRSAVGYGQLKDGRSVVFFGDVNGYVHMVDAKSGQPVWVRHVGVHPRTAITAPLLLDNGVLYVAHSSLETLATLDPDYECCQLTGAISAHDPATGDTLWLSRTLPVPQRRGGSKVGTPQWGPAGASVWSAPVIDHKRGLIIVGTGPVAAPPDVGTGDALIAFDLHTGERRWVFQATPGDLWNGACRSRYSDGKHPNCDFEKGRDFDFGAGVVLATDSNGRDVVLAGQKSGVVWALDPASGRELWRRKVGEGSTLGGVHWGMTLQGNALYVPVHDPQIPPSSALPDDINQWVSSTGRAPGLYKLDISSGNILWTWRPERDCKPDFTSAETWPACPRQIGLSGAAMGIEGAVISVGADGVWRVHDIENGQVLRQEDTAKAYIETVNGVPGHGGSLDNATTVAADDMLYVQSGYGFFGGTPGNVLIAYALPEESTTPQAASTTKQ
ncbi:PQQ-binding-like beta-propeller repeat protein [Parahaliea mediterranea]|uniref:outer membrane protein assembly factor BamB family protein n=1 Tax=Parahaliea mediterranea TaxID=651086 RepID=UPI000E2F6489|nr:PQQ-binding-like beta-propeller repeat protein [Parahaliea mediterranea]